MHKIKKKSIKAHFQMFLVEGPPLIKTSEDNKTFFNQ